MATDYSQLKDSIKNTVEGWNKWQIALAVGAPIALGLAGLWYYKKSNKRADGDYDDPREPLNADEKPKKRQDESPKAKLPPHESQILKNEGNDFFKNGNYDLAIDRYTKSIEVCPLENSQEKATFYQNRAAAYEQLKNPQKVIEDCTEALKLNSKYKKALLRRARASEQIGELMQSLEDVTALCILEGFQERNTMEMADRVLKENGKKKARETYKSRKPSTPSKQFIEKYYEGFVNDPIKCAVQKRISEKNSKCPTEDKTDINSRIEQDKVLSEDKIERSAGDAPARGGNSKENTPEKEPEKHSGPARARSGPAKVTDTDTSPEKDMHSDEKLVNGDITSSNKELSPFDRAIEDFADSKYDQIINLCTEEINQANSKHIPESSLLRGSIYMLMGASDTAVSDFSTIIKMPLADKRVRSNALIKRGNLYMQTEKQAESLDDFAAAVRIDPDNSDIYHHRGQQNLLLERFDDAIRDFEKSISLSPTFPTSYVQKCFAEHRSALMIQNPSLLQNALKTFEDTMKKFPKCGDVYLLYGQALCDQGKFEEADASFKKAVKLEPDNATSLVYRGLLKLQWKQDIVEAVNMIEDAIKLDSKCEYAYEVLGTIEVQKGDMKKAVELFDTAIELSKSEAEMAHLFSLKDAAVAQLRVAQNLGIPLPSSMMAF